MDLIAFYTSVLTSFGLTVQNTDKCESVVHLKVDGVDQPVKLSGKIICLPTYNNLRNPDWDTYVAFHPICENNAKGEYPTLKWLRKQANYNLTLLVGELWTGLMDIAVDKTRHSKLTPDQLDLLRACHEADSRSLSDLKKIVNSAELTGSKRLIAVVQKHSGKIEDVNYRRTCNISFPIADQFTNKDSIFDIPVRAKGMKPLVGVFEYMFPDHEARFSYCFGSNSECAPYFHSLIGGYLNIARRVKELALRFRDHLPNATLFDHLVMDWADVLDNIYQYKGLVPALDGNKGEDSKREEDSNAHRAAVIDPSANTSRLASKVLESTASLAAPVETVTRPSETAVSEATPQRGRVVSRTEVRDRKYREDMEKQRRYDEERSSRRGADRPVDARERYRQEEERYYNDRDYRRGRDYRDDRDDYDRYRDYRGRDQRSLRDTRDYRDRDYRDQRSVRDPRDRHVNTVVRRSHR